jgi:hypothetical protein
MFGKRGKTYDWILFMFGIKEKDPKIFRVDFIMYLAKLFKHNNKNYTTQVPTFFFLFFKKKQSTSSWNGFSLYDFKYPTKIFPYLI